MTTTAAYDFHYNYIDHVESVQGRENSVTDNINTKSLIVTGKDLDKKVVQEHEELVIGIETLSSPNPRKDKSSGSKYS